MRATHPASHVLRAHLDGEIDWARAAACTLHLARCPRCAAELEELRALDRRAATLVARSRGAGWPAARPEPGGGGRDVRLRLGAGALAAAVLALLYVAPPPRGAVDRAPGVKDVCCWDLDGGGRGDDGVFTRVRDGEVVECAIVYDDVDASHSLTAADVVRSAPPPPGCTAPASAAPPPSPESANS